MKGRWTTYLLFLSFVLLVPFRSMAQDVEAKNTESVQFDRAYWQDQIKELNYDRSEKIIEEDKPKPKKVRSTGSTDGVMAIFKFLMNVLGAVLIIFLLAHFLGIGPSRNAKDIKITNDGLLTLDEIEDDIENIDIHKQIEMALNAKDFKRALRLQYLLVIQELTIGNLIQYKKEKTNRRYLQELKMTPLSAPFQHMTQYFEMYWYGDKNLTEDVYINYKEDYTVFERLLKEHHSSPTSKTAENE